MKEMIEFYIPIGMCRSVEWKIIPLKTASRQGCIPDGMQREHFGTISTERFIPNGMRTDDTMTFSTARCIPAGMPQSFRIASLGRNTPIHNRLTN